MKILAITIPLAQPGVPIALDQRLEREAAVMEELHLRIPALLALKGVIPSMSTVAVGNQQFMRLLLLPSPQMSLDLADWRDLPGRVIEMDAAMLDQASIETCLQTSRMLLALAERRDPQAMQALAEFDRNVRNKRALNAWRKHMTNKYILSVLEGEEEVQLPLLETMTVEPIDRTCRVVVTQMFENVAFKCRKIQAVDVTQGVDFKPRATQVFAASRIDQAACFSAGRALHHSMEQKVPVELRGRFVLELGTEMVVGLQVRQVRAIKARQ